MNGPRCFLRCRILRGTDQTDPVRVGWQGLPPLFEPLHPNRRPTLPTTVLTPQAAFQRPDAGVRPMGIRKIQHRQRRRSPARPAGRHQPSLRRQMPQTQGIEGYDRGRWHPPTVGPDRPGDQEGNSEGMETLARSHRRGPGWWSLSPRARGRAPTRPGSSAPRERSPANRTGGAARPAVPWRSGPRVRAFAARSTRRREAATRRQAGLLEPPRLVVIENFQKLDESHHG